MRIQGKSITVMNTKGSQVNKGLSDGQTHCVILCGETTGYGIYCLYT